MEQSTSSTVTDFARDTPTHSSPPQSVGKGRSVPSHEAFDTGLQNSSLADGEERRINLDRSVSTMSQTNTLTPSRGGTLKKKQSLRKTGSMNRRGSRKSLRPGSVSGLEYGEREKHAVAQEDETYSAFYTPVPTTGSPTDILADRFQVWRKVLKDLITYYRDIQKSYEVRSKSLMSISNVISTTTGPAEFLSEGGISEATQILKKYHKQSLMESNKAKNIEEDVVVQLAALRSDLQQKIKEIKNLSGDFKNSVDKETENTRKAVRALQESLGLVDTDPSATSGKGDPFIVRLGVERQIEKQIDEENYLHRAFLNLENSGRELESIVVGEIQKAYNAYAGILRREADEAYEAGEHLKNGPVAIRKDLEWNAFVASNGQFVDPKLPIRKAERIHYPGKDAPAAAEVRSGMLERKSKYLKSYTPGWYVLSPTHLHEFKSADRISFQSPIMSLYLPDQKLGSRSNIDSSSHKFMLKGRQTGGLHRGHGWVFRAESRDTMLAWYEDIKNLTEKTGEERNAFVRRHIRSVSGGSHRASSISSDGAMEEDEADQVPYSGTSSHFDQASPRQAKLSERPQPGGRFPSDLNVNGGLRVPLSPSSGASSDDQDNVATADVSPPARIRAELQSNQTQRTRQHQNSTDFIYPPIGISYDKQKSVTTNSRKPSVERPLTQRNYGSLHHENTIENKDNGGETPRMATFIDGATLASIEMLHRSGASSRQSNRQVPRDTTISAVDTSQNLDPNESQQRMYLPVSLRQSQNVLPVQDAQNDVTKSSTSLANPIRTNSYTPEAQRLTYNDYPAVEDPYYGTHGVTVTPTQGDISTASGHYPSTTAILDAEQPIQHSDTTGSSSDGPGSNIQPTEEQSLLSDGMRLPELSDLHGPSTSGANPRAIESLTHTGSNKPDKPRSEKNGLATKDAVSHPHRQAIPQELLAADPPPSKTAEQIPQSVPVELGEFGSTPRLDGTRTFDSMLSNFSLKSVEFGYGNDPPMPSRPKATSQPSSSTISDLHVPGAYPRAPEARATH